MAHAKLSPSSAVRWLNCPGSVALSEGIEDKSSKYADEGTDAHGLAALCLITGNNPADYRGEKLPNGFEVNSDMIDAVGRYVDAIRDYSQGNQLFVEQVLSIEHITGEEDAEGTGDAIIFAGDEIQVHDLKYGTGVEVDAEDNPQLMIYGLGALAYADLVGYEPKRVRLVIHQPRKYHTSEWTITTEELLTFGKFVKHRAELCFEADAELEPGVDQCRWCKAKATCPALTNQVLSTVADDFVDLTLDVKPQLASAIERITTSDNAHVASCLNAVDLIEDWCKAVRARVETELLQGHDVPGYKLVEGKKGHRKWVDELDVEAALKSFRLKEAEMYDFKLISPTTAEKLAKSGVIGERQWPKLQKLITQSQGAPSVAPLSDKRPALQVGVEAFEVLV